MTAKRVETNSVGGVAPVKRTCSELWNNQLKIRVLSMVPTKKVGETGELDLSPLGINKGQGRFDLRKVFSTSAVYLLPEHGSVAKQTWP